MRDIPEPSLVDVAAGRGVLVRVLRVGLDGTDHEITAGEYGEALPVDGLESWEKALALLGSPDAIKVSIEVAGG